MFWDARAHSLEEQALEPIKTLEEMRGQKYGDKEIIDEILIRLSGIKEYKRLFALAFPGEKDPVKEKNLARAIAAYERTLIANNSRFDQYMRGDDKALSLNEKDGLKLFLKSGCAKCHNGPMLSDYQLHTLGAPDTQNRKESDSGINKDYAFRTPTLRNLNLSGPYMHSGKLQTLKQVLEFYEDIAGGKETNPNVKPYMMDSLIRETEVNFKDIPLILEFLTTLNDPKFDKTVPEKVPSGLLKK
jgi:cytochrome c peroxidase